jgi:hypothetical protein
VVEVTNVDCSVTTRGDGRDGSWHAVRGRAGVEARVTKASHLTEAWFARLPRVAVDVLAFPSSMVNDCRVSVTDAVFRWGVALNDEVERATWAWTAGFRALAVDVDAEPSDFKVSTGLFSAQISMNVNFVRWFRF